MYKLIIILALLISAEAPAANLTWSVTTTAGTVTQASPTISEVNMTRFIDWLWYAYPQLNEDGTPKPDNNANRAQAFRDWAEALWQGTKANVINYEKNEAAQATRDAIGDIG